MPIDGLGWGVVIQAGVLEVVIFDGVGHNGPELIFLTIITLSGGRC